MKYPTLSRRNACLLSALTVASVAAMIAILVVIPSANAPAQTGEPQDTGSLNVESYQLVNQKRISQTVSDLTYKVTVSNAGTTTLTDVVGTVTTTSPNVILPDNQISFGDVEAGSSQQSTDTFVIRQDRAARFNADDLDWGFVFDGSRYKDEVTGLSVIAPEAFSTSISPVTGTLNLLQRKGVKNPLDGAGGIFVTIQQNPDRLSISDYYDGDPGPDLRPSHGVLTVASRDAIRFVPAQSLSGHVTVVAKLDDDTFIEITDITMSHQSDGLFEQVLNGISVEE